MEKRQEILDTMKREEDDMSVMSPRGREVDAIDQIMRQRGLK